MLFMFDVGQTLLNNLKPPVKEILERTGIPKEKKPILTKILFTVDYDRDINNLIRNIEFRCDYTFSISDKVNFMDIVSHQQHESFAMEGSKEFTNKVMEEGLEYCIVSNIWKPFYLGFKNCFPKFNTNACYHFLSHEMNCRKPFDEFYNTIYHQLPTTAPNTCIIGDRMDNDIKPVLRRGGYGIWFNWEKEEFNFRHDRLYVVETYDEMWDAMMEIKSKKPITQGSK